MKKYLFAAAVLAVSRMAVPAGAITQKNAPAFAMQEAFNDVATAAKSAVVNIQVVQEHQARVYEPEFFFGMPEDMEDFFNQRRGRTYRWKTQGLGSGVIIDAEGYVLTNEHVVRGADEIKITRVKPDGKEMVYSGRVAGSDPKLDIAVVRITAKEKLPYLSLGDSDKIKVGDWVIAVGYPFGFNQTVTAGIISAVKQSLVIEGRRYPELIQTDAAINQGNSGGPLLNLDGEVVGINSAIFSPSGAFAGIGFSIPANEVKGILTALKAGKKIKRGWLGVTLAPLDSLMAQRLGLAVSEGALVNSVLGNSPAAKSGIKRGDIIVSCDGKEISSAEDLVNAVSYKEAGSSVKLELHRKGIKKEIFAVLAEQPDENAMRNLRELAGEEPGMPESKAASWEGMEVAVRTGTAEIINISPDSKLYGYLKSGDILNGINQKAIKSEEDFRQAVSGVKLSEGVVFDITRDGQPMYVSVQVK